ncbi:hypothetical protein NIES4071_14580 [Calothrix sp. NIES-4071]|nr:hypothetical protein NIES4071_14580 [Calothrix sp. NIES-4071]BAZ55795.1 hypothetical protein NIES4105_14530 [Calothrix sp. NIES-4105]
MANFNKLTFSVVTLTVTQVVGLFCLHSLRQEKIGDSKTRLPLISQATVNPPNSGKPKGSSGAGSRRIENGNKDKDIMS